MNGNELRNEQVDRLKRRLKKVDSIFLLSRKKKERLRHLIRYGIFWNSGDIQGIVDSFSDSGFIYRDLVVPGGVSDKKDLKIYLEQVFETFPCQIWTLNSQVFSPFPGSLRQRMAVYYSFQLFDSAEESQASFSGTGMENYTYNSLDGNMTEDTIHLVFDQKNLDRVFSIRERLDEKFR